MQRPTVFDLAAHFEPSSGFKFSRRVRNDFERLARRHSRSTLLLGRFGGKPAIHTDIQGIGVSTRVELGRLSLLESRQQKLFENAFQMFGECLTENVASGPIDRIVVSFDMANERPVERQAIRRAYEQAFADAECHFLAHEPHVLELGRCVEYQTLFEYLREDGLYHSVHRGRIDTLQRHLHQEVGRYENHSFYVKPQAVEGAPPELLFCYSGPDADRRVEAYIEGYTDERSVYVSPAELYAHHRDYVELGDYERASRRFGGVWILQGDIVSHLGTAQLAVLYLFLDEHLQPEHHILAWSELFERMRRSRRVDRASRTSPTFLEMALEALVKKRFITAEEDSGFRLDPSIFEYQHASFYRLGEFRQRDEGRRKTEATKHPLSHEQSAVVA